MNVTLVEAKILVVNSKSESSAYKNDKFFKVTAMIVPDNGA